MGQALGLRGGLSAPLHQNRALRAEKLRNLGTSLVGQALGLRGALSPATSEPRAEA